VSRSQLRSSHRLTASTAVSHIQVRSSVSGVPFSASNAVIASRAGATLFADGYPAMVAPATYAMPLSLPNRPAN